MSDWTTAHLCQPEHRAKWGLMALYRDLRVCATSTAADTVAIRSHIAYWSGCGRAERVQIKPSRGQSYRVMEWGETVAMVRVTDPADHREGVTGWR